MDVQARMEQYEQEIKSLKEEIMQLKDTVEWLRYCKAPNEKYIYWNWLIEMRLTEQDKTHLDLIMMPFLERFNGKPINELIRNKLKRLPVEGLDVDDLCRNEIPHYPEFAETVSKMMGWEEDKHVRAFLMVNYRQGGRRKDFCAHLLQELGESPYSELYSEE